MAICFSAIDASRAAAKANDARLRWTRSLIRDQTGSIDRPQLPKGAIASPSRWNFRCDSARSLRKDPTRNLKYPNRSRAGIAKARWGETFELKCLEGSGAILEDEDAHAALLPGAWHGLLPRARGNLTSKESPPFLERGRRGCVFGRDDRGAIVDRWPCSLTLASR
jgi:hypothetical protein